MTIEQQAKTLKAVVVEKLRSEADRLELMDFCEQFQAAMDDGERVLIARKWLWAFDKVKKFEAVLQG